MQINFLYLGIAIVIVLIIIYFIYTQEDETCDSSLRELVKSGQLAEAKKKSEDSMEIYGIMQELY